MADQALRKFDVSNSQKLFIYLILTSTQQFTQAEIVSVKIENKSSVIKTKQLNKKPYAFLLKWLEKKAFTVSFTIYNESDFSRHYPKLVAIQFQVLLKKFLQ